MPSIKTQKKRNWPVIIAIVAGLAIIGKFLPDKETPVQLETTKPVEKFKINKSATFPDLVISNITDEYKAYKGQYYVRFDVKNTGKRGYDIVQINGKFFKDGKNVGEPITGYSLDPGEQRSFELLWIVPEGEPDNVILSIDNEATFLKK